MNTILTPKELIEKKAAYIGGHVFFREGGMGAVSGTLSDIILERDTLYFKMTNASERLRGGERKPINGDFNCSVMSDKPTGIVLRDRTNVIDINNPYWGEMNLNPAGKVSAN